MVAVDHNLTLRIVYYCCTLVNSWKAIHVVAKFGLSAFASSKRERYIPWKLYWREFQRHNNTKLSIVTKPYFLFSGQMIQKMHFILPLQSHKLVVSLYDEWRRRNEVGKVWNQSFACNFKMLLFYGILCDQYLCPFENVKEITL